MSCKDVEYYFGKLEGTKKIKTRRNFNVNCVNIYIYICIYIYTYINIYVYIYIYIFMFIYFYTYMSIYIILYNCCKRYIKNLKLAMYADYTDFRVCD